MSMQAAADLLGVQFRTLSALIARGELPAEVTVPPGPKRRRSVRLRRQDVEEFIERSRVKPGELAHLNPPVIGRYLRPRTEA